MHVAEVDVVQTSLHSGFVGELQDLVRSCGNIPHLEVRMKGSEVNGNITPDFREYPIDNAFQLSGSSFAPGITRLVNSIQQPAWRTAY